MNMGAGEIGIVASHPLSSGEYALLAIIILILCFVLAQSEHP